MKQLSQFINEAKATYCGRCGTTHVSPAKGGTCPALKEEDMPWHEDPKNPTRKVGVRKDQYGNVIKDKNLAKHLAKKAMQTKEEVEQVDEVSAAKLRDYTDKASDARGHRNLPTAKLDKRYKSMALAHEKIRARHAQVAATEETAKTLSQFIEEAVIPNSLNESEIAAHAERVKKLKGKQVSFEHPVTKQKITGKMMKVTHMGGLPYAHVETGKSAHRVPVHQVK
jgi:hypothetical protein